MKYLLDTHVAKWALDDTSRLSDTAKAIIGDTSLHLCISVVSAWEIAIKVSVGKLNFAGGSALFLEKMRQFGVEIIGVNGLYVEVVETLPFIHRDPFDRLIISTAITENMTIITADKTVQKYDVPWIW